MKCIGFGDSEGECENDTHPNSPHWCTDCDNKRIESLDKQFVQLAKDFGLDYNGADDNGS